VRTPVPFGESMPNGQQLGDERWVPRCPKCGEGNLLLAPANQYTHAIPAKWELYCQHCQWQGRVEDHYKTIYVRM